MPKEIELRVIDIKRKEVERRLRKLGAKHVAFRNYKRMEVRLINTPKLKRWIRVRTDGKSTRFTLKEHHSGKKEIVHEYELSVNDFRTMCEMLLKMFSKNLKAYVESTRDEYLFNGTEVTINKWPEIPVFMEIEGESEKKVNDVFRKLSVKGKPTGNVWDIYTLYGKTFANVSFKTNDYIGRELGKIKQG